MKCDECDGTGVIKNSSLLGGGDYRCIICDGAGGWMSAGETKDLEIQKAVDDAWEKNR